MKPDYAVYVIEISWSFDHTNFEYATITNEGRDGQRYEPDFEEIIASGNSSQKKMMVAYLRRLANTLNGGPAGAGAVKLIRLYRVVDDGSNFVSGLSRKNGSTVKLEMTLKPICDFDSKDEIRRIPPAEDRITSNL